MKAIVQTEYGMPDVLQLREVETPSLETMKCRQRCMRRQSMLMTGT